MPLIKWKENYNTGISSMDAQHQTWVSIINEFYDQLNKEANKKNLEKLLEKAINYTNYHFEEEESMMEKHNFSGLAEQKKEHDEIREKLREFKERFDKGRLYISIPVTTELKSWFQHHITEMDKEYGEEIGPL